MYYGRQIDNNKNLIGYISSSTPLPYNKDTLIEITLEEYTEGCQQIELERAEKIKQEKLQQANIETIEPNLPFEIQDDDINSSMEINNDEEQEKEEENG